MQRILWSPLFCMCTDTLHYKFYIIEVWRIEKLLLPLQASKDNLIRTYFFRSVMLIV